MAKKRLKRGVFRSIVDLQTAINRYIGDHNQAPKPFVWSKHVNGILDRVAHVNQALESLH